MSPMIPTESIAVGNPGEFRKELRIVDKSCGEHLCLAERAQPEDEIQSLREQAREYAERNGGKWDDREYRVR